MASTTRTQSNAQGSRTNTDRVAGLYISGGQGTLVATTLNNAPENGTAPVIAARTRLDIGAQMIDNRDQALIFSAGDLAIGGALDANRQASGQAGTLNNASATIEALGNLNIAAARLNNSNEHFSTAMVALGNPESRFLIQDRKSVV